MPESNIASCPLYIANLLTYYNKTSTNDLDYYWLEYLWNDYSGTGQQWECDWRGICNNKAMIPATDASVDFINAYFVLQSFNHWSMYMRVHRNALFEIQPAYNSVVGTYDNFKSDEKKWPANPQPYDPASLVNIFIFVLSSVPSPGLDTALPCVDF
jgi:hypothetical protein